MSCDVIPCCDVTSGTRVGVEMGGVSETLVSDTITKINHLHVTKPNRLHSHAPLLGVGRLGMRLWYVTLSLHCEDV